MSEVDPRVAQYFAKAKNWRDEMQSFRAILLGCPLHEEYKWRGPVYTIQGGNVATIFGLKNCCAVSFFKGVLLKDAKGILVPPGENSRSVRMFKVTDTGQITALQTVLKDYVLEAIDVEKAGLKVDFPKDDFILPPELTDKLAQDPDLKTAFEALTPGRQRGYVLHFSQSKNPATRISRIEKSAPRILDGKGRHDR